MFFYLILSGLVGSVATEVTDDKIDIPILEEPAEECPVCPEAIILAYTAEGKKYICEGIVGPDLDCINTEEILSELG